MLKMLHKLHKLRILADKLELHSVLIPDADACCRHSSPKKLWR